MTKNWQTMLLALSLAIFTWFLVTGREVVETWVDMPLIMTNPPEGMIIEDGLVDKIQVRLRGPKGLVDSLSSQSLSHSLDVSDLSIGQQVVEIDSAELPLPPTYEIIEVKPNRLRLTVDRRIAKMISLEAVWSGALNNDYKLLEVTAAPELVEIKGPETLLRKISKSRVVLVEDFPEEVPRSWAEDVAIELPEEIEASPGQVRVEAFFGPKTREIWVKIPLTVASPEGFGVRVAQDYVRLLIEGPIALFRTNDFRQEISATLAWGGNLAVGTSDLDYDVVLPEGCRLVRKNPETIATTFTKK